MDSARASKGSIAESRSRAVSLAAGALAGLSLAGLLGFCWLGAETLFVTVWALITLGYLACRFLVSAARSTVSAWLVVGLLLAQYVQAGFIVTQPSGAPTLADTYLLALPLLIGNVTLPMRWRALTVVAAAAALAAATWLGGIGQLARTERITGLVFALVVFGLSLTWTTAARCPAGALDSSPRTVVQPPDDRARSDRSTDSRPPLAGPNGEIPRYAQLLTECAQDLCALATVDTIPVYLNPAHAHVLGQPLPDLMHVALAQLAVPDSQDEYVRAVSEALERGHGTAEVQLCCGSGQVRIFDMKVERVDGPRGPLLAIISRDITERRRLQQRLMASERMESLARLAGSVAHDFNNLLMVIGGAGELARHAVKDNPRAVEDLDSVLEATHNASKLTRQLLAFSRKQVVTVAELDLAEALYSIRELLERLVGNKIQLQFDFEPCPKVMMAAAQLEQLAMDLAMNARDAMPQGGSLVFALRSIELSADTASLTPGIYAELSVKDEGTGISEEVRQHLFEPLFTTKGDAGTGLGLPTCQNIALEARGSIGLESAPGQGTTFRVRLPSSALSTVRTSHRPSPIPLPIRRVLVVDDEPAPRETAARMLRASGFDVVVAASLEEARQCIEDPTLELDALLTDVVLHGELGTDLLEDCRRRRPQTRIVVMSGYSPHPDAAQKLMRASAKFLPKPFSGEQLLSALGSVRKG